MGTRLTYNYHRELAKDILSNNPETRNCDYALWFKALEKNGIFIPVEIQDAILRSKVNFKTLFRERQLYQSKGQYLPTDKKVARTRSKLDVEYTEHYSNNQLKL